MKFLNNIRNILVIGLIVLISTNFAIKLTKENKEKKEKRLTAGAASNVPYDFDNAFEFYASIIDVIFKTEEDVKTHMTECNNFLRDDNNYEAKQGVEKFFLKCSEIKDDFTKWDSAIVNDTIGYAIFNKLFFEKKTQNNIACGSYISTNLVKKPNAADLKKAWDKKFGQFTDLKIDAKFVTSMYNVHRDKLIKTGFTRLNKVSRGELTMPEAPDF
jgi:hypothetical protein